MAHVHAHSHAGHAPAGAPARTPTGALRIAFAITATVLVLEALGGWWTGSLALLADAGHMLTDAGALGIALFASWVATRPRSDTKSFGYGRAEILAALANGLLLGAVSATVAVESIERLREPRAVAAAPMLAIAVFGLAANVISALFLARAARQQQGELNLNVRAALLHVLGDALGSVAAITAALGMLVFGYERLDALASLLIAAILVFSAVRLVREATHILLEGTPAGMRVDEMAERIRAQPGVRSVHDLHVWMVTSGFPAMSAHVDLEPGADPESVRAAIHRLMHQDYGIEHTTIQTEAHREPGLIQITEPPAHGRRQP